METALWTWSGIYFGYRDGDDLWTHDGRLVGRFHGDDVYGTNGDYLGEMRDSDRLITKTSMKDHRKIPFGSRQRGMRGLRGMHGLRGILGGYEDFPDPDSVI